MKQKAWHIIKGVIKAVCNYSGIMFDMLVFITMVNLYNQGNLLDMVWLFFLTWLFHRIGVFETLRNIANLEEELK